MISVVENVAWLQTLFWAWSPYFSFRRTQFSQNCRFPYILKHSTSLHYIKRLTIWYCRWMFSATTSLELAFRQLFRELDPCGTIAIVDFLSPPVVNPLLCALSGARYVCDALCVDHHHCQWRSYKTFYDSKSSAKFIYLPTTRAHYKELGVPKMATNSHDRCCYCNLRRLLSFIEHTHNMCVQQRWWRMDDMGHSAIKSQSRCRSCSWQWLKYFGFTIHWSSASRGERLPIFP